jgi:microcystin-dependent protein
MSTFYLGQIMLTGFNFAPKGLARCDGQLLSIAQQQALFSLLGVTYGGNGSTNFQLPDLRGITPVGVGPGYDQGSLGGNENITLTQTQIPAHSHTASYTNAAGAARNPAVGLYGQNTAGKNIYANAGGTQVQLNSGAITGGGSSVAHANMQPYTVVNFCIALTGIYPTRN